MDWNWHKLPESEHAELIAHFDARRWAEIAKLCEKYGVSLHCCCNAEGLQAWLRWAIEKGIIKQNDERIQPAKMVNRTGGDGGAII